MLGIVTLSDTKKLLFTIMLKIMQSPMKTKKNRAVFILATFEWIILHAKSLEKVKKLIAIFISPQEHRIFFFQKSIENINKM